MSSRGLERGQDLGISEWLRRLGKYGMKLGSALDNAVVTERTIGPWINSTSNKRTIERIVNARERLADQVELARKSVYPTPKRLAEEAVMEYAAVFDHQAARNPAHKRA